MYKKISINAYKYTLSKIAKAIKNQKKKKNN